MSDLTLNILYWGDCLKIMRDLPSKSVDMILVDPPYGSTRAAWDERLPMDQFWQQHLRIIKDTGVIAITAVQPYSSLLVTYGLPYFRYDLIWRKNKITGHLNAKIMPLRQHEHILIFYQSTPATYNPQKTQGHKPVNFRTKLPYRGEVYGNTNQTIKGGGQTDRYPTSVLNIPVVNGDSPDRQHSAQKPVALFEWLIRTYSNPGEIVLDSCMGSGTTAIAAMNTDRDFIGIELDKSIYEKAKARIARRQAELQSDRIGASSSERIPGQANRRSKPADCHSDCETTCACQNSGRSCHAAE